MRDVDKGHAWLSFIAVFGAQFFNGAITYGFGIFHMALLDHFKENVAKTALVGSLFGNFVCLLGPLASVAINLSSCRVSMLIGSTFIFVGLSSSFFARNINDVLITYGIIAGVGFGFNVTTAVVVIGYAFEKYRGVAIGLCMAATGAGMFLCGPMHQYFIDEYSLHGAYLLLGGISSNCFVFGALMKPSGLEEWHRNLQSKNGNIRRNLLKRFIHFEVFKNSSFWCILIGAIFVGLPYSLIFAHLPNYSITQGLTHNQAAFLLALIGLGSTVNRVLVGLASGEGGIDVLLLYFGSVAITGVLTAFFPFYSSTYLGQSIYALGFGLYSGAIIALTNPIAMQLVGLEQLPTAVGLHFCCIGIGGLIGPPVAGLIVDNGGTYDTSFYISGACLLTTALFTLLSAVNRQKTPTNLIINGDIDYTIDKINGAIPPNVFKGSGFLSGSGYFGGSGFMAAPEIFSGSGSFRGSGFLTNRYIDSKLKINSHENGEAVPLNI